MIPAPVTRSATTVPGSGIAVGGLTGVGVLYMFCQSSGRATSGGGTRSAIGGGDSITGTTGTGSAIGAGDGDSTTGTTGTGSAIGAGDGDSTIGTTGTGFLMTRGGWVVDDDDDWLLLLEQAREKFPGPHTYCAEAGGAAAR